MLPRFDKRIFISYEYCILPLFSPQGNGNNLLEVGLSLLQECSQTLVAIGMQTGSGLGLSLLLQQVLQVGLEGLVQDELGAAVTVQGPLAILLASFMASSISCSLG